MSILCLGPFPDPRFWPTSWPLAIIISLFEKARIPPEPGIESFANEGFY